VKSIPAAGEEKLTAGLDGEAAMKRLAIFSAILIPGAVAALARSGAPSARFSNLLFNDAVRKTQGIGPGRR
jgi:hypothetical protein